MDENMVDESTYWEEFGKCVAEHKDTEVIPGCVMAPHDSNLKVPYKAWCHLRWLEATNMSWAEDYAILDKAGGPEEAIQWIHPDPEPSLVKKQASFDEVGRPDHRLQDGGLAQGRVPDQQAPWYRENDEHGAPPVAHATPALPTHQTEAFKPKVRVTFADQHQPKDQTIDIAMEDSATTRPFNDQSSGSQGSQGEGASRFEEQAFNLLKERAETLAPALCKVRQLEGAL